ncbi:TPA: hypothetical protein G8N36_003552 [Salmonella enterica]|uniref:Uncharacterized protein n=1 Tax=Salmonella enterica TaxID=28901 RepID=A0A742UDW2_SALER|nr:hypothetical protein [Salmonella enterica]HAF4828696.1 hypothetical protein [Salmonella enterica]
MKYCVGVLPSRWVLLTVEHGALCESNGGSRKGAAITVDISVVMPSDILSCTLCCIPHFFCFFGSLFSALTFLDFPLLCFKNEQAKSLSLRQLQIPPVQETVPGDLEEEPSGGHMQKSGELELTPSGAPLQMLP